MLVEEMSLEEFPINFHASHNGLRFFIFCPVLDDIVLVFPREFVERDLKFKDLLVKSSLDLLFVQPRFMVNFLTSVRNELLSCFKEFL